ncbi:MAG: hypothetical protein JO057_19850 [Chloroflexi bacterium]|nr:hypothetical protein [Chloroflexota bacterium]
MQLTFTVAHMLVRVTGVLLLILGLLFWTGDARGLIPVHMLLGVLLVLSLWLLAAVASQLGAPAGMVAGAAVLGLIVAGLGFSQTSLLPGSGHWIIQVLHLLVGMAAIAIAEVIGGRLRRNRLAASTA